MRGVCCLKCAVMSALGLLLNMPAFIPLSRLQDIFIKHKDLGEGIVIVDIKGKYGIFSLTGRHACRQA
ncbi:hypothetical protein R6Q59_004416 [Mikania micrantha]